jgi:dihydrofolate reductase
MKNNKIITLHMVSSLDGIIAKKDNSVSWFESADHYENGVFPESSEEFMKTVDCFVMGYKTYEHATQLSKEHGWPYGVVPTVVTTHRNLTSDRKSVSFFNGNLHELVNIHLKPHYNNIWVVGGANLAAQFIDLGLADEIRLSIMPIILGDGLLFFDQVVHERLLLLKGVTAFKSGMVELWYEIRKT